MALVSLVDENRQWFKAKCGLTACETGRDVAFCSHAILQDDVLVIPNAPEDPRFADNPLVTGPPNIRFYAGAPLKDVNDFALGTLCLIDDKPRDFDESQRKQLKKLAGQVTDQIKLRDSLVEIEQQAEFLEKHNAFLEREVERRTEAIRKSRNEIVECLARAAEYRDDDTGVHVKRVSQYVAVLAEELGLSKELTESIAIAATLHDVGKIGVPDSILLKEGKLSEGEFSIIKDHTWHGQSIIADAKGGSKPMAKHCEVDSINSKGQCSYDVLRLASRIASTHHEKWDGSGYPNGLKGTDIPLEGRITAVADVFDALSSKRPYKDPFPIEKCFAILQEGRGSHFDPAAIDAFFARKNDILRIRTELTDDVEDSLGRVA
jgi:response regulator RpfG family c-di-GMP phosphodiesterase